MKIRTFVKQHFEKALQRGYIPMFAAAAKKYDFPLALLMAIASRETNMNNMQGDYRFNTRLGRKVYNGYGIMQVDINTDESWCLSGAWRDVASAIMHGTKILDEKRDQLNRMWKGERTLKDFLWTLAASYNTGAGRAYPNFKASGNPDATTTGKDYGRDVLGRMAEFKFLLDERNLDVVATAATLAATPAPVDNQQTTDQQQVQGAGSTIIQTGKENTVEGGAIVPVEGGGVNDALQALPTTQPEKSGSFKAIVAAVSAPFVAAGIGFTELIGNARTALAENPIAMLIVLGILAAVVAVYWKYQDRQTKLDLQREQQAHERDMANLKALTDPKSVNVAVLPPANLAAFMSKGGSVVQYATKETE